jgi:membrane associated rhomboid family serine protease
MLFPIGDDNQGRLTTPVVVYVLIAINVIVFLLQLSGGDQFTLAYAAVPYKITHNVTVVPSGVRGALPPGVDESIAVRHGQAAPHGIPQEEGPSPIYVTLLTSMFMHGGLLHIGGNMLYLWIFGDNIEDNFGHLKFLIFYLICGFAASLAQILADPDSIIPSLGASGAIAGVLGAYLIMFPRNRVRSILPLGFIWTTIELPAIVVLGFWIVIQIASQYTAMASAKSTTQSGGVAYMAHIGGFISGLILCFFLRQRQPRSGY